MKLPGCGMEVPSCHPRDVLDTLPQRRDAPAAPLQLLRGWESRARVLNMQAGKSPSALTLAISDGSMWPSEPLKPACSVDRDIQLYTH